jgi:glutamate formiminotransferase
MSSSLIECVPNFSEGRNKNIIDQIVQSIESVPGVKVLHTDMGYDTHRTVISFVGDKNACKEAGYRSILSAFQLIDMKVHQGAHPRLGAVDVFPFIPLRGYTMQDAIDCSVDVGKRIADEFSVPVYLYNQSAKVETRKSLAFVRKGEYEGLKEKLLTTEGKPDFGPPIFHPKIGALTIGARKILLAYNFNLDTRDTSIAKKIATALREKNGGLKSVRAIGWYMPEFNCAQVSANLIDLDQTPLHIAFEACSKLAVQFGAEVTGSELVGLIPLKSLVDTTDYFYKANDFSQEYKVEKAVELLGLNTVRKFIAAERVIEWLV